MNMPVDRGSAPNFEVADLAKRLGGAGHRIVLWGEMGVGKSTLARGLVAELGRRCEGCQWIVADPGSPLIGVPGAVTRARWSAGRILLEQIEALCTLDAARFRLPLIQAVGRLLMEATRTDDPVVVDPPGVAAGVAGAELLTALVETVGAKWVLTLHRGATAAPLGEVLATLPVEVVPVRASERAKRPPRARRAAHRTGLWDRYLDGARLHSFELAETRVLGTPPPFDAPSAWLGRQIAVLDEVGRTAALGEVISLEGRELTARLSSCREVAAPSLLVRDAVRASGGQLVTAPRLSGSQPPRRVHEEGPPPIASGAGSPPVSSHVGWAWATLVGGVLGDPLLHVRLRHLKRSLLFDLGDPARLAAKMAHQVSDVFLSHAHIDHIGGFPWFLRSRIGPFGPCRIFGPAGTIDRIGHFIEGVTWDRIGDNGPVFEVAELLGDRLRRALLQPGKKRRDLPELWVQDGVLRAEPEFSVRAVVCDHGIPALAYAFQSCQEINVRKDRLAARALPPGPWLGRLKRSIAAEAPDARIPLPDGTTASASDLSHDLLLIRPGKKLAYAADSADTPENRRKLTALAAGAHTFYCEAAFTESDRSQAEATQHLTARAAAEIARAAGVERLAPFHFSRRYELDPRRVYKEIIAAAGPLAVLGGPR